MRAFLFQEHHCSFGWALESVDLNGDGLKDLIIGTPWAPSGGIQRGLVGVFYASPAYQSRPNSEI